MKKNQQVEGLRGISIIIIVIYHIFNRFGEIYLGYSIPFIKYWGTFGVIIFLLITSYFINPSKSQNPIKYVANKLIRLWPCYFICITITMIFLKIFPLPGRMCSTKNYFLNIFFINGFINRPYVDGAHWYLQTIIILTIVMTIMSKLKLKNKSYMYIFCMILITIMNIFNLTKITVLIGGKYFGILSLGQSLKMIEESDIKNKKKWIFVIVVSIIFTGIAMGIPALISVVIILPIFTNVIKSKIKILENKIFLFFGKISYPLYLIHQNVAYSIEYKVLHIVRKYNIFIGLFSFIVVILIAVILYYFVEVPARNFIKSKDKTIKRIGVNNFLS